MLIRGRSRIQRFGIFTDVAIPARSKIGEYTGERISIAEGRRRSKGKKRIAIVEVDYKVAIDGDVKGNPFRWINHSCQPNVFIRIAYGHVEFYSMRAIRAGEELTCDYGVSMHDGTLPCRCGTAKCRKWI